MRFSLRQTAVYWAPAGADGFGRPTLAAPVVVRCRWEDGVHDVINGEGEVVASGATVFLATPVLPGGVLYLGKLSDVTAPGWLLIVKDNVGTREIISTDTVPDLKGRQKLITANLK
jgi:hypothetical protein